MGVSDVFTYFAGSFPVDKPEGLATDPRSGAVYVLHGLGKDAKAIKFMVGYGCDKVPLFTRTSRDLAPLQGPAWLVMSAQDFARLEDPRLHDLTPTLTGTFDKDAYVLLHLEKASPP